MTNGLLSKSWGFVVVAAAAVVFSDYEPNNDIKTMHLFIQ